MARTLSLIWLALTVCVWVLMAAPATAAGTPPNVVVILIDALRADVLGPYGYTARNTTPTLNRFASRSVVFEHVISQAGWTVPSVASLFTGVDPQAHQVLTFKAKLSSAHQTMAEQFKAGGYSTTGLLKSIVVEAERGYSQGFENYTVINPKSNQADGESGRELTDAAISFLETQKSASKPFFLYLHYMDVHSPYKAPEPYYSKYRNPAYTGPVSGAHKQIEDDYMKGGKTPSAADIQQMKDLYDAEVEYWDAQFGRFMQALVSSGMDPNTIVVVTADHGEAFFEHPGNVFHGNVYHENINIPLIMKIPGVAAARYSNWAQSIDIPPTLADLTGIAKGKYWQGHSQAPVIKKTGAAPSDAVACEYADFRTVIDSNSKKLILGMQGGPVLFDLKQDPLELKNIASSNSADVERLRAILDARTAAAHQLATNFPPDEATDLTPEQIEQLKALGYLHDQ